MKNLFRSNRLARTADEVDVEVLPTSMVFERGHRLRLVIGASDRNEDSFVYHTDPDDRARSTAPAQNRVDTGAEHDSYLLSPSFLAA